MKKMKIGDIKIKRKFSWVPTMIDNKYIWLKYYIEKYIYENFEKCVSLPFGLPHNRGKNGMFFFHKCNRLELKQKIYT